MLKSGNSPKFNAKKNGPSFLPSETRVAFNRLRLAFIKALIFWHFHPKCYIQMTTNWLGYAINGVLNQLIFGTSHDRVLTKANLSQLHLVAIFFRNKISGKTQYKTHNNELLAIIKVFKIWRHYLEICKHEVFILRNHTNIRYYIDTKSLSFRQAFKAQSSLNTISK